MHRYQWCGAPAIRSITTRPSTAQSTRPTAPPYRRHSGPAQRGIRPSGFTYSTRPPTLTSIRPPAPYRNSSRAGSSHNSDRNNRPPYYRYDYSGYSHPYRPPSSTGAASSQPYRPITSTDTATAYRPSTGNPASSYSQSGQAVPITGSRGITAGSNRGVPQPSSARKGSGRVKNDYCQICSFKQEAPEEKKPVHHQHFSSIHLRDILGVEATRTGYFCPSCKSRHFPYPKDRTKIVVSDSTLHNFFAPTTPTTRDYEGDTVHTDYVTIPGAPLETLFVSNNISCL